MKFAPVTDLNQRAAALCEQIVSKPEELKATVAATGTPATVIDCGIEVPGSIDLGLLVARVCMSDLVDIQLTDHRVSVATEHPIDACIRSQYAGWMIKTDDYFAMGSGSMRAAAAVEDCFEKLGGRESADVAVGTLEARQLPTAAAIQKISNACRLDAKALTLLVMPTASIAGAVQVVARSVETAIHKLMYLDFDIRCIQRGSGSAPLPPLPETQDLSAADFIAMGQLNDAVLYGAEVKLWCDCDDETLELIYERVPSHSSSDYGKLFGELFEFYDRDFYKIDKLLFSPARVTMVSSITGREFTAGSINQALLERSYGALS